MKKPTSPSKDAQELFERLHLKPELVPRPLWNRSLCRSLGSHSKEWRSIRQDVINLAKELCHFCGVHYDKGMICHEVWNYNDKSHLATLTGFKLVCRDCSAVLHLGFTGVLAAQQEMEGKTGSAIEIVEKARAHLIKVNKNNGVKLSDTQARAAIAYAFAQHAERSKNEWRIKVAPEIIRKYPLVKGIKL